MAVVFSIFSVFMSWHLVRQLLEEKDSKNTKRTYKVAQQVFHEYLLEKGIAEPKEKSEISRVLKRFYVEERKKDGSAYTMESLRTLKDGLKIYLKTKAGVDIDVKANKCFSLC